MTVGTCRECRYKTFYPSPWYGPGYIKQGPTVRANAGSQAIFDWAGYRRPSANSSVWAIMAIDFIANYFTVFYRCLKLLHHIPSMNPKGLVPLTHERPHY